MSTTNELLTAPQVGQLLGCSGRTVVRRAESLGLRVAQKLPGLKGAYLYKREDVEALIATREPVAL